MMLILGLISCKDMSVSRKLKGKKIKEIEHVASIYQISSIKKNYISSQLKNEYCNVINTICDYNNVQVMK